MQVVQAAPLAPVIAHRGASGSAPENTLAALRLAADMGARCVEIDVGISCDGIAYLHHDERLGRCVAGDGRLCELPSSVLDTLTAGGDMPGFGTEPLPRLTAALELITERTLALNLEIKPAAGLEERTADVVCQIIGTCWPVCATLVLSSFSEVALCTARRWLPDVPRALITGAAPPSVLHRLAALGCRNLHCSAAEVTAEIVRMVDTAGYGIYCYTVNDADTAARLYDMGVHGVFTDYPERLL